MSSRRNRNRNQFAPSQTNGRLSERLVDAQSSANNQEQFPAFCFKCLEPDFAVSQCDAAQQKGFANRLVELSALNWGQIFQTSKHQLGMEKVPVEQLRVSVPQHVKPDAKIVSFRFHSLKGRMIGYRDATHRRLFHILWLDRNHNLF